MIHRPDLVRAIAERLVAIPSVSPDVAAETRCARALAAELPGGIERGEWLTADGRPVVWALARGASARTVVLLGHYDTVGFGAEASSHRLLRAGDPEDDASGAFAPDDLDAGDPAAAELRRDLEERMRRPGTWMFGRGALDMKSGLAAAVAVLHDRRARSDSAPGSVLFVATPDEEHLSAGMRAAVGELAAFRDVRKLDLAGVVNLDYGREPCVHLGVVGKIQLGCYVLGRAGHVADPGRESNALDLAARVILALTSGVDWTGAARPAVLKLDDLKAGYSIEPPTEALLEFSVPWGDGSLDDLVADCRRALENAPYAVRPGTGGRATRTVTAPELLELLRSPLGLESGSDPRARTLALLRSACEFARIRGPAVVLHLLPPFYPPAPERGGDFTRTVRRWAEREEIPVRGPYPYISDASYVAWSTDGTAAIARHLWALGHGYSLPIDEARALDLEVANLGPWGRDAHRPWERVHAPYAFERLPGMLARLVDAVLDG